MRATLRCNHRATASGPSMAQTASVLTMIPSSMAPGYDSRNQPPQWHSARNTQAPTSISSATGPAALSGKVANTQDIQRLSAVTNKARVVCIGSNQLSRQLVGRGCKRSLSQSSLQRGAAQANALVQRT